MKIKLPNSANVRAVATGLNDVVIKIKGKMGWDILQIIADYNVMHVIDFAKLCDPGVYSDHIIIDADKCANIG